MIARNLIRENSGSPVRWVGGFAVAKLPAGRSFLTAPPLAGDLCAALDAGAAEGLIIDMSRSGISDSTRLEALMRAARRARDRGSWLRLVIPDAGVRAMVRLVALDEVMPVHASVPEAIAAAGRETTVARPAVTGRRSGLRPRAVRSWRQEEVAAWSS
jgi:anti-sigma B factor antagonist